MTSTDVPKDHKPCCVASRAGSPQDADLSALRTPPAAGVASKGKRATSGMVRLAGGEFLMGTDDRVRFPADGEGPVRPVVLKPFWIDTLAVSNERFAAFVDATGYLTDAERYGWSFVFGGLLPEDFEPTRGAAQAPWWRQVYGANWRQPEGPHSSIIEERMDHPVVHVSWQDATSYCAWVGMRLPTEAEWEYTARGGLEQKRYAWGDELKPDGKWRCNIWQGVFPLHNTLEDGYLGTAPVDSFPPNGFGLHNVSGNVWEWCSDWFHPTFHGDGPRTDPMGPSFGQAKVIRGGSYLCHDSYCNRYRVAARSSNTLDSSTGNMGFRCVKEM
jgi:formylglycine-generating enzyme